MIVYKIEKNQLTHFLCDRWVTMETDERQAWQDNIATYQFNDESQLWLRHSSVRGHD